MPSATSRTWLNRFAWLTCLATLLLICSGGMVTSKNVGLAVPDWPTTFGYNMFLFPVSKWVGGILFEHTHRLMGSVVGFLTIILAVWLWLREDRPWVRSLGVIALGGVILQGILGGLRVTMMKDEIGIFHACIAQAFLGLLVVIALVTTNFWQTLANLRIDPLKLTQIKTLAIGITLAIYLQLALGATMRHQHRDLAILDFPTANGAWIPDTSAAALAKINAWRAAPATDSRMKTAAMENANAVPLRNRVVADLAELVKARLTLLVLLTTAVGFYLGSESPVDYVALFHVVFGTAAAAAGAAALNQWWERRVDALMRRTRTRPIPAGRMPPLQALVLGIALSVFGVAYLAIVCNLLSAALAAITIAIYILAYTPLKRTSTGNTAVGAIPGAIPPMIGWAAARGNVGAGAWGLFAIIFLWQLPHFFAIAWMYREDYSRAGFRMISSDDRSGEKSASQSVFFCILLLVMAGLPAFLGIVNFVYLGVELLLGGLFIGVAMRFIRMRSASAARALFLASIVYLPLVLAALVLTKS